MVARGLLLTPYVPSAKILSTKRVLAQVRDQLARYAGQPPQRRGEGGLLAQHLDDASAAVDPDPVAAVQAHGGVAASDHGRDAELAGHDRGMGQWRADVGDDGRGAGEDQRPADVGDRGDQDLAVTELSGLLGRTQDPRDALDTPAAPGKPVIASPVSAS
jgi:hypothetical protein